MTGAPSVASLARPPMASTIIVGNGLHSVSQNGTALFSEGPFSIWFGNLVLDLASAPLPRGIYKVQAETVLAGNVEVYLPRDARYTLTGTTGFGGRKVREGLDYGKQLQKRFHKFFGTRSQVPELTAGGALTAGSGLSFELELSTLLGDVKVYRL